MKERSKKVSEQLRLGGGSFKRKASFASRVRVFGLDGSVDSSDLFSCIGSLICIRGVSGCLFFNLLSECFSSAVPGWLGLREPDTLQKLHIFLLHLRLETDA